MKIFAKLILLIGILVALNTMSFAESQNSSGSLFSLDVLNGPADLSCGDTLINLKKNANGASFGSSLLKNQDLNAENYYSVVTLSKSNESDSGGVYYFNYIRSGHFKNTNLIQSDFDELFGDKSNSSIITTFYKDNMNRYFLKAVDNSSKTAEYTAIQFFRSGISIVTAETDELSSKDNDFMKIIEVANMIKAKSGQSYQDFVSTDIQSTMLIKEFLTIYLEEDVSDTSNNITATTNLPKESRKTTLFGVDISNRDSKTIKTSAKNDLVAQDNNSPSDQLTSSIVIPKTNSNSDIKLPSGRGLIKTDVVVFIISLFFAIFGAIKVYGYRKEEENARLHKRKREEIRSLDGLRIETLKTSPSKILALEEQVSVNQPVITSEELAATIDERIASIELILGNIASLKSYNNPQSTEQPVQNQAIIEINNDVQDENKIPNTISLKK